MDADPGGGSSASDVDELAETFEDNGSIQYLDMLQAFGGALLLAIAGAWLEFFDLVVSINVWALDNIGAFLAELISETFFISADAQSSAWATAGSSMAGNPLVLPFVLGLEALFLYLLISRVRDTGVVP